MGNRDVAAGMNFVSIVLLSIIRENALQSSPQKATDPEKEDPITMVSESIIFLNTTYTWKWGFAGGPLGLDMAQ